MVYLGSDVLLLNPNRVTADQAQDLARTLMDAETGPRTDSVQARQPSQSRSFDFTVTDLGAEYEVRDFVMSRQGRLKPFWLPTWQRDLSLVQGQSAGDGTIKVRACGYAEHVWSAGAARRHLLLRSPAGAVLARRVTVAVDNGDGTETLTLVGPADEPTLGTAITTAWLVMFLRLVRLDSDEVTFEWLGGATRIPLPIRELPQEVPA